MILIKLNVKNRSTLELKKKLKDFGVIILIDNGYELIVQFSGTQNEIRKVEKLISPFIIIEKTRSGLVSMTIGTDYIKK